MKILIIWTNSIFHSFKIDNDYESIMIFNVYITNLDGQFEYNIILIKYLVKLGAVQPIIHNGKFSV